MRDPLPDRVLLGGFEVDRRAGELHKEGRRVRLQEQPFQILLMLIERSGELVTREEIQSKLWPNDTVVEFGHGINAAIKKLRQALGDTANQPAYVETVARRGYRLLLPAEPMAAPANRISSGFDEHEDFADSTPSPTGLPSLTKNTGLIEDRVSHYRVLRIIGSGGMGLVYEAEDLKLGRHVALKFLPQELARHPVALQRFEREAQTASSLNHPNICTIHEIDEYKGKLFIVMELLEGETLRSRLADSETRAFSLEGVLDIAIQACNGLQAAHEKGIVHRDIKPANIFITSAGQVKILDFGLAKLVGTAEENISADLPARDRVGPVPEPAKPASARATLTRHGAAVGTAGYMSPEQLRGEPLDARSDLFSFGLVLYEMATGRRAFTRGTVEAVNEAILNSEPAPFPESNQQDMLGLVAITHKALEKDREQRYQSAAELGVELQRLRSHTGRATRRWWLWVAATLLALAVGLGVPLRRLPQQKHIAVLPFENIGNDAANQAFAQGVAESLTSKLSQLQRSQKSFWVVPSSDTRNLKNLDEAYRNLKVTLAVTGSIAHTGDGVNLTANLVDPKNHRQLASRSIHVNSANLEEMQQLVWESVADMLDLQVSRQTKDELAAGGTNQPFAYELYERGVGYLKSRDLENTNRAISLFEEALAKDPNYVLAYAALGDAYATKYGLTKDPQWIAQATHNAGRAVQLNDRLIPVRVTLAHVYQVTGQLDKALAEYQRVQAQDQTAIEVEYRIGQVLNAQGNDSLAESSYKDVIARRPTYWQGYVGLGALYYQQGQFAKAAEQFQSVIDLAPDEAIGYYDLGGAYLALGRNADAIRVLNKGLGIEENADAWANLGAAYMYLGKNEEAAAAMKKATELAPHDHEVWRNLGDAYDQIPSRHADARQAYAKALETATAELKVNPKDPIVLSGIALYHAHLAQPGDAEIFMRRALEVAPSNSDTLFTSALVYEIIGRREQALKAVDEAVKAGYSLNEVEKEPELRKLQADPRYQRWLQERKSGGAI